MEKLVDQQQFQLIIQEPVSQEIIDINVSLNQSMDEIIAHIVDIDELDVDTTQLAPEYVEDIYNYLFNMEVSGVTAGLTSSLNLVA